MPQKVNQAWALMSDGGIKYVMLNGTLFHSIWIRSPDLAAGHYSLLHHLLS